MFLIFVFPTSFKGHTSTPSSNYLLIFEKQESDFQVNQNQDSRNKEVHEDNFTQSHHVHTLLPGEVCNLNNFGDLECINTNQSIAIGKRVWADINPKGKINTLAPTCHLKKEHLLSAFIDAVQSQDINKIIDTYHWEGKSSSQANEIIERLSTISPQGQWQRSYIINWNGKKSLLDDFDVFVRWKQWSDDEPVNFSFNKTLDCWFLEFTTPPASTVSIEGERSTYRTYSQIDESQVDDYGENYIFIK